VRSKIRVDDFIANFIFEKNVPAVFQLSGGMIAFISDAIYRLGKTPIYNLKHEQAAGFAAEGAARVSGIPAIAMGTSGPGATNLITAIGSAYFDSSPVLFITGQVNQSEMRRQDAQRQSGFQELDIVNMVKGITKYSRIARTPNEVDEFLHEAWESISKGRKGPALIDIPIDVQQEYFLPASKAQPKEVQFYDSALEIKLNHLDQLLTESRFPLIIVGGGVRSSGLILEFKRFVEKLKIPVVTSLMGVDALASDSPFNFGMLGAYGTKWANQAVAKSDLLLVLGSRLDGRQTGNNRNKFYAGKKIVRVEIDPFELNESYKSDILFEISLKDFFSHALTNLRTFDFSENLDSLREFKDENPIEFEQKITSELNPNKLMARISSIFDNSAGYIVDVGQHQMWAAQSLVLNSKQRFITSGGMGAMGFALPTAIGASLVSKEVLVAILGDGCAQISLAELETIRFYNLPLLILIINNGQHGMVSQFQTENLNSRFFGTRDDYSAPNFSKVAESFGIRSLRIENMGDFKRLEHIKGDLANRPYLVEIIISSEMQALPKMSSH
jgi:acetolactate synthase-1/2/3 large subunit